MDLRDYAQVHYQPDAQFNEALRRLRRGQYAEAGALLAAVRAARPQDAEALILWAQAAHARSDDAEAVRILLDALELAPTPEVEAHYAAALAGLEAGAGAPTAALVDLAGRLRADIVRFEAQLHVQVEAT
jgi:predicted Zn-dependent protease